MARLKTNNNLSGAIGNIVFVNDGKRVYVRTKPDEIKQTKRTKAAASVFGEVSKREKWLRRQLLSALHFPALQYFAARHRARIRKTVIPDDNSLIHGKPNFGSPEALVGLEFNPNLEWSQCTNFFPTVKSGNDGTTEVHLPELKWGQQIKAPKDAALASLTLCAVTVDMNSADLHINKAGELSLDFQKFGSVPAQVWTIPAAKPGEWLLVLGSLYFERKGKGKAECFSGCYLWAG